MALWGDKDNISVGTGATAYISSYTKTESGIISGYPVVGSGSVWGSSGYAQVGDIINFGSSPSAGANNPATGAAGTYYGSAVINYISGNGACYIASTEGIISSFSASAGIATVFSITQSPKFALGVPQITARKNSSSLRQYVAGVSTGGDTLASGTQYETGVGWVGVQTYIDSGSNLRVKKEILVSMSGIATGNAPIYDSNPTA